MPQLPELVNAVLFFVPGLLLVQMLYLGGVGHKTSSLDRIIWGIIASIPIRLLVAQVIGLLDMDIEQGLIPEMVLALAIGVFIGFILKEEKEEEQA